MGLHQIRSRGQKLDIDSRLIRDVLSILETHQLPRLPRIAEKREDVCLIENGKFLKRRHRSVGLPSFQAAQIAVGEAGAFRYFEDRQLTFLTLSAELLADGMARAGLG